MKGGWAQHLPPPTTTSTAITQTPLTSELSTDNEVLERGRSMEKGEGSVVRSDKWERGAKERGTEQGT